MPPVVPKQDHKQMCGHTRACRSELHLHRTATRNFVDGRAQAGTQALRRALVNTHSPFLLTHANKHIPPASQHLVTCKQTHTPTYRHTYTCKTATTQPSAATLKQSRPCKQSRPSCPQQSSSHDSLASCACAEVNQLRQSSASP